MYSNSYLDFPVCMLKSPTFYLGYICAPFWQIKNESIILGFRVRSGFPELKIMRHSDDVMKEKMKKARELSLLRGSAGDLLLIRDSSFLEKLPCLSSCFLSIGIRGSISSMQWFSRIMKFGAEVLCGSGMSSIKLVLF